MSEETSKPEVLMAVRTKPLKGPPPLVPPAPDAAAAYVFDAHVSMTSDPRDSLIGRCMPEVLGSPLFPWVPSDAETSMTGSAQPNSLPKSDLDWKDISDEQWRSYTFPTESGLATITVHNPKLLSIKAPLFGKTGGGSHRIVCMDGSSYYITYGWLSINWQVKDGKEPFAF